MPMLKISTNQATGIDTCLAKAESSHHVTASIMASNFERRSDRSKRAINKELAYIRYHAAEQPKS